VTGTCEMRHGSVKGINLRQSTVSGGRNKKIKNKGKTLRVVVVGSGAEGGQI
jgi:hypothetical protein